MGSAPLPLLATLITAFVGTLPTQPPTVRVATIAGVVVAGLCGVAAVVTGIVTAVAGAVGDQVFGLSLAAGGLAAASTLLLLRPIRR